MSNKFSVTMKRHMTDRRLAAVAVMGALALITSIAKAAVSPDMDTIGEVQYVANQLTIKGAAGLSYVAKTTAPPAPCAAFAQTLATLERWQELGTAALLSGKELRITYCISGSGASEQYWITGVDLLKG